MVPLGLKRQPLKSTTYNNNNSQPAKKSLLDSLDDDQFWYELLMLTRMDGRTTGPTVQLADIALP